MTITPDLHADAVAILTGNMTPREVDEQLAVLHTDTRRAVARLTGTLDSIHRYAGDESKRVRGVYVHKMTGPEAIAELRRRIATLRQYRDDHGSYDGFPAGLAPWDLQGAERALAVVDELEAEIRRLREAMRPFDAEYARRPWSRFFLVTSSDGHVHSSTFCSTTYATTTFGWLPQLSGKSEADAVDELGPALCSVCFPSAPVQHVGGKITKARAAKMAAEAEAAGRPAPAPQRPYLYSDASLASFNRKGLNDVVKRLQLVVPPRLPEHKLVAAIKARQDELRAEWAEADK